MTVDLLHQLEQKVAHAVEIIELLRLQVEELEEENAVLKAEHDKWRRDLMGLIKRFDQIEVGSPAPVINRPSVKATAELLEEEFMTV